MSATAESALARMQEALERVRAEPVTGDTSLDMLLTVLPAPIRQAIEILAVPHAFGQETLECVADFLELETDALLQVLLDQPFVRERDEGILAYHDVVRESLRGYLQRNDPERYRRICRELTTVHPAPARELTPEHCDAWIEHLYLRLAWDEEEALAQLVTLFDRARGMRALVSSRLVVSLTEEQAPILSETGRAHLSYFRGLAAFDRRNFPTASETLRRLDIGLLPPLLRARVALYRGRILEETGQLEPAIVHYRKVLKEAKKADLESDYAHGLAARLHQRLGTAALAAGRVGLAEKHARRSLRINRRLDDAFGLALNHQLLGRIHRRLGDAEAARRSFKEALALLRGMGRDHQVSEVLIHLGQVRRDIHRYEEAEAALKEAADLKERAGDHFGLASAYADLGKLELMRRRQERALEWYEHGLNLLREFREPTRVATILENMAIVHSSTGEWAEAVACQERALETIPAESPLRIPMRRHLERLRSERRRSELPWIRRHSGPVLGWGGLGAAVVGLFAFVLWTEARYEGQIGTAIEGIKASAVVTDDARVALERLGTLSPGQRAAHRVHLSPDSTYEIWGVCDEDCRGISVSVHNEYRDGPLLATAGPSLKPHLAYTPEEDGPVDIDATMGSCRTPVCYYGVLVVARLRPDRPQPRAEGERLQAPIHLHRLQEGAVRALDRIPGTKKNPEGGDELEGHDGSEGS